MRNRKKELKKGLFHIIFIFVLLSIIIFVSWNSDPSLTGFAVYDEVEAKTKIETTLSASAFFNQITSADMCIVIKERDTEHSFNVIKDFTGLQVLESEGFCKGLFAEDLVIRFNDYDSFLNIFDSFTPANIISGRAGVDYYILESKFVRKGGNVDCNQEFVNKYCSAMELIATTEQLIEADLSCCATEMSKSQRALLAKHLEETGFTDEAAASRQAAPTQILSGTSFTMIIYIVFGILIIGGAVVFFVMKKPKKPVQQVAARPPEDPKITQLKDYIKLTEMQGYAREDIYAELIDQGWPQETLDKIFSQVR